MAVSRRTEYRDGATFWTRVLDQLSRYDVLLAAIPLLFALALSVSVLFAIPFHIAVSTGAVLSIALVADALYFNAPTGTRPEA